MAGDWPRGLAELVRRAIDETYGTSTPEQRRRRLDLGFGAWADLRVDGAEYVEGLRHGLRSRLDRS